ncbi:MULTISPECIES: NAD(P)-dependent oxidoreductase [unclassified Streptomyces]|uniref:NAD(P)-dependent oxidoreductase n=1 Tax=unclassified Streptomyces TaxID=2593676 RepID=UPI002E184D01
MSSTAPSAAGPVVAVLGTGTIGAPMARNLARAGFTVRAWNRTRTKAEPLAADGVTVADSASDAVRDADVVVTVLPDGPRTLDVVQEATPKPGTVWVQSGTVGEGIDELAEYATRAGLLLVDAPVLGTRQPAEQGTLTVLAAGADTTRASAQPLFDAIGSRTLWVGDGRPGAASRLKLALNSWVLALTTGVGEALALAQGLGVDANDLVAAITGGPLDSGYFQTKSAAIRGDDYTPSFSVDNAAKDAGLVLAAAERAGIRVDAVEAARDRFQRASEQGHGEQDMAATYFASFPDA